jgi:hypothetical protein
MQPEEVGMRLWQAARDRAWRATRRLPIPLDQPWVANATVPAAPPGAAARERLVLDDRARECLAQLARRLASGEDLIMGWGWHRVGSPPAWRVDPVTGKTAPAGYGPSLDYRNPELFGEARRIWEMSRHHRWVAMAWAWRAGAERLFPSVLDLEIRDWCRQNPFPEGPNWGSALEAALRLVSWSHLLRSAGAALSPASRRALADAARWSIHFLSAHRSVGSSANNHAVGEAMGMVVGADAWPDMPGAGAARDQGWRILAHTVPSLADAQGWPLEQSRDYGSFLLELLLAALESPSAADRPEAQAVRRTAASLTACLMELDRLGEAMIIGDGDEGKTLPAPDPASHRDAVLSVAAAMALGIDRPPRTAWGCVVRAARPSAAPPMPDPSPAPDHRLYDGGGTAVLAGARLRALVDVGPLGFGSIAAHAHADALQVLLWLDGRAMLIDPGMPTFFEHPDARDRYRAAAVHNTLSLPGLEQSEMLGPFLWGRRARIVERRWSPRGDAPFVEAAHDGYRATSAAALHRRRVTLRLPTPEPRRAASDSATEPTREFVEVLDTLEAPQDLAFEIVWQCHPGCRVEPLTREGVDVWRIARESRELVLRVETAGAVVSLEQGEISPRFGVTEPAPRLVVRGSGKGTVCRTWIGVADSVEDEELPGGAACPDRALSGQ